MNNIPLHIASEVFSSKEIHSVLIKVNFFTVSNLVFISIILILLILLILAYRSKGKVVKPQPASSNEPINGNAILERNQLRTLIDAMPDFIYIKDKDSKFLLANKNTAQMCGFSSPDELIGKTDKDIYSSDMANGFYSDEQEIIKTGKPLINHEEPVKDSNGNDLWLSTTKVPLLDENGKIVGIIGVGRDITALKKTEESLKFQTSELSEINTLLEERQEEILRQSEELKTNSEKLLAERNQIRTLIDNLPDSIYFKDAEARFIIANNTVIKVTKAGTLENLIGKNDFEFYPKKLAEKFYYDDLSVIKSGKPIIREEVGYDRDGNEVIKLTTKVPLIDQNGVVTGLVGIGRDITKLKLTEQRLIEQTEHLQEINVLLEERQEEIFQQSEELKTQAENLKEANEELEKLNATKDKFFSIIAHDLKNPFHAITGFSDLLIRKFREMNDSKIEELINLVYITSESAYSLLENLLQWARTQTNEIKYVPETINVFQIVNENIGLLTASAKKKNISLTSELEENTKAYADKQMVYAVIRNLINNALKFTKSGGKVMVTSKNTEKYVEISVSDTGLGIREEDIDKLFRIDKFHSTTGTSGETGTGLGLIICSEFIKKNGGKMNVTSELGKGSTFTFTLPLPQ
ncbi:MAG: PAS domain-containing protein [Bacteroidales bacterium]|nr:PAS domain-containing protein [Bacteroidales bacterium]